MDFSLSEEQEAIRDLARQILSDNVRHERLLELEKSGEWFDLKLWQALTVANLPGVALPEEVGGSGFGPLELCLVLEELGRHVAPVPLFASSSRRSWWTLSERIWRARSRIACCSSESEKSMATSGTARVGRGEARGRRRRA